jgi:hypothetical protein
MRKAVAALVTQAQADGLAVHQMGGFDTDAVRAGFGLADALAPVVLAVGRQDSAAGLPAAGRPRGGAADQAPGQRPAAARLRRAPAGRLRRLWSRTGGCHATPTVAAKLHNGVHISDDAAVTAEG